MRLIISFVTILFCMYEITAQHERKYKIHTIAFYNLENLFHPEDDPLTFDDDRTPEGKDHWTEEIYFLKIENMAKVLSEIGKESSGTSPAVIGVCEVENRIVLEDIITHSRFDKLDYGIVHYDSPDRRGIDVALLYNKKVFTPSNSVRHVLKLYDNSPPFKRIYTRDQLAVSGYLDGEKIHLIVSHWPSRSGGEAASAYKRIKAAHLNRRIIDSIFNEEPRAKIITMGDLNDDPTSKSVKKVLKTKVRKSNLGMGQLFNPMEVLFKKGMGTLAWRDGWNLFDQMIVSSELMTREYSSYRFYRAGIFNKPQLVTTGGKYKGYPFRSFSNGSFTGGYSDHFPVFLYLIKLANSDGPP